MPDDSPTAQLARIVFGASGNAAGAPAAAAGVAAGMACPPRTAAIRRGPDTAWTTYGGDLASHRYSPADHEEQLHQLAIAWRVKTDFLGGPVPTRSSRRCWSIGSVRRPAPGGPPSR